MPEEHWHSPADGTPSKIGSLEAPGDEAKESETGARLDNAHSTELPRSEK